MAAWLRSVNLGCCAASCKASVIGLALVEIAALHNDQNPNERVATVVITRLGFTLEEERMGAIQRDEVLQVQIEAP